MPGIACPQIFFKTKNIKVDNFFQYTDINTNYGDFKRAFVSTL
jgi:hypothetical protein